MKHTTRFIPRRNYIHKLHFVLEDISQLLLFLVLVCRMQTMMWWMIVFFMGVCVWWYLPWARFKNSRSHFAFWGLEDLLVDTAAAMLLCEQQEWVIRVEESFICFGWKGKHSFPSRCSKYVPTVFMYHISQINKILVVVYALALFYFPENWCSWCTIPIQRTVWFT